MEASVVSLRLLNCARILVYYDKGLEIRFEGDGNRDVGCIPGEKGVLQAIKRAGRRSRILSLIWGKLRWYTTSSGLRQIGVAIRHLGWTVQCPFCGWRGSSFYATSVYSASTPNRPNAICPGCYSKKRHRLLYLYLKQQTNLFSEKLRVLEIAPGPYSYRLFQTLPHAKYISLDYESTLTMCRGDITSLPLPDASFDLVICYHVLEHVVNDRGAIKELHRILSNDGLLLVQVPIDRDVTLEDPSVTDPEDRKRLFGQEDHVRAYGKDFVDRLVEAGFVVQIDDFAATLPDDVIRRYGLTHNELIYACDPDHEVQ